MRLNRSELIAAWVMAILLGGELFVLCFLMYFANLPFFLFLFTVVLRVLSYFFLGATILLLILIIMSIRPDEPFQAWVEHFKEYLRNIGSSFLLASLTTMVSLLAGFTISFLLQRLMGLPALRDIMQALKNWVDLHFY